MAQKLDLNALDIAHNVYYQQNPENFLKLLQLVQQNIHCYFTLLKNDEYHNLTNWIKISLPELDDAKFKYSTKVYWIFVGLTSFPKCKQCGNDITCNVRSLTLGYYDFCSTSCQHKSLQKPISMSKAAIQKRNFDAELQKLSIVDQLKFLVSNFEDNYVRMIQTRKYLMDYVIAKTPLLSECHNVPTRLYWIFNCIQSWDNELVKCKTCNTPFYDHNIASITVGYPKFCCQTCVMKDPDVVHQIGETCITKYGTRSPAQNHDVQKKTKAVYFYNGQNFKSMWELAFYIYNKDKKTDIEYCPDVHFSYTDENGVQRKYFPDFQVDGKLYEVKGDHFFKADGTMQNPFDHSLDVRFELKHQCGLKNDVTFLTKVDIQKYIDYIVMTYGKDFLQKFRKKLT